MTVVYHIRVVFLFHFNEGFIWFCFFSTTGGVDGLDLTLIFSCDVPRGGPFESDFHTAREKLPCNMRKGGKGSIDVH